MDQAQAEVRAAWRERFHREDEEAQLLPAVLSLGWIFLQGFGLLFLIHSSVERVPDTMPTLGERVQLFSVSSR